MVIARPMALGRRVALLATVVLGGCFLDYDKLSSVLDGGAGVEHCGNGMLDGDERDVDCGGSCGLCGADHSCTQDTDCSTGSCVLGSCARASAPPFWLTVTPMPTARTSLALATGSDGRLYALGGSVDQLGTSPGTSTVDAYSPEDKQWISRAPMGLPRRDFGATTGPDGRLYVIGGETAAVEAYTPGSDLWTAATPVPKSVSGVVATTGIDGGIYAVFFDRYVQGDGGILPEPIAAAQVYRGPPVDRWDALPELGFGYASPTAATAGLDGRLYVLGGGSKPLLSIAPGESAWRADDHPVEGKTSLATGADGLVYAVAGSPSWTTVEAYIPAARRWVARPPLNNPRRYGVATRGPDGRIYVAGGWATAPGPVLATVEAYGPLIELSAQAGGGLSLTGQNFAANATVTVTIGTTPVATGTTDANGALVAPLSFSAPTESGSYRVQAVDNRSAYPVSAALKVP